MGIFVANKAVKLMNKKGIQVRGSKALLLGITFKENCPDIRNSKTPDIYDELKSFGMEVDVFDPHADSNEVSKYFGIKLTHKIKQYDVVILTVAHDEFIKLDLNAIKSQKESVVYDLKSVLDPNQVDARL
jgi:UDP-N-acetyl-D-galactosamine dehydrogenase